jgi:5-methyltetrahydropteroyltriglutamate--homocysteine methyltransferase
VETAQSDLDCEILATLDNKQILVGCLDLSTHDVETPETIVARIKRALPYVAAENVILAPDCGMKYLPRSSARGKIAAMVEAAKRLRAEYSD